MNNTYTKVVHMSHAVHVATLYVHAPLILILTLTLQALQYLYTVQVTHKKAQTLVSVRYKTHGYQ